MVTAEISAMAGLLGGATTGSPNQRPLHSVPTCWSLCALPEEGEDREDAAVIFGGVRQIELLEDPVDVRLDGLRREEETLADSLVGAPLGHQSEHVAFALGELGERVVCSSAAEQAGHDLWIDRGFAAADASDRGEELAQVTDAVLEQVSDASRCAAEQVEGVVGLHELREDEYAHICVLGADLLCGFEALDRVGGGHADVEQNDVRPAARHNLGKARRLGRLPHDVEAAALEHADEPFAEEERVVGDD